MSKIIITSTILILAASIAEGAVLDPALYLVPSPPLVPSSDSISPAEMWGRAMEERITRDVLKEENIGETSNIIAFFDDVNLVAKEETTEKPLEIESRMFWPRYKSPEPVLGIQIPLTFSLSGSYGKSALPTNVLGKTYANANLGSSSLGSTLFGNPVVASSYGSYGRTALAGSSYGSYGAGVRVYGSDNAASWSGWGNGRWGHYGKG